ncbi:MAG: hypothetical protein IPQ09_22970 [Myxococcales bacterium]|nr:hypothetical protein [Myxococcales bacterium]
MERYDEHQFRAKIDAALGRIRTLLDNTRNPQYPADVPHGYDDKYLLAERVTELSIAALFQCLEVVGLPEEGRVTLRQWAETRSVTLRLEAQEDCRFLREETRTIDSPEVVTEARGFFGKDKITSKVVTKVTDYFWSFDFSYALVAYQGNEPDKPLTLLARIGSVELKTGAKTTPRPLGVVRPPVEVNVTWLLGRLDAESRPSFAIDRTAKACHTPRRNPQVEAALAALEELHGWCARVLAYFQGDLFPAQPDHGRDLSAIHARDVFVPVLPLFEGGPDEGRRVGEGDVLPATFRSAFLAEERRSLAEKCRALSAAFPSDGAILTAVEGGLLVTLLHAREVCQQFSFAVDHIEDMLRKQLIAAIGKEVTPDDFNAYMQFHHQKLVKPEYRPRPFSYAIRRPDHYPEGVLTVEAERGSAMPDPISTTVASSAARHPMSFALDASTRVSFLGERFLHAWISHEFSGQSGLSLSLVARARQFSSFILMVGRIASADVFEPRHAVILQNKDLLKIPLMLEQLPTPKEFRDAIESLSPEQQRFAKAFRGMQLESTLFAVCVVQIKPQLEKLLKLEPDSLTKEIKLTQELLSLFIEYQIPSDLLSYDGPPEAPPADKLARVAEYVGKMLQMIHASKQREIAEEQEREALRLAELNRSTPVYPSAPVSQAMAYPSAGPAGAPPGFGGPLGAARGGPPPPMMAGFAPPPQGRPGAHDGADVGPYAARTRARAAACAAACACAVSGHRRAGPAGSRGRPGVRRGERRDRGRRRGRLHLAARAARQEVRGARRGRRAPRDDLAPRRSLDAHRAEGPALGARGVSPLREAAEGGEEPRVRPPRRAHEVGRAPHRRRDAARRARRHARLRSHAPRDRDPRQREPDREGRALAHDRRHHHPRAPRFGAARRRSAGALPRVVASPRPRAGSARGGRPRGGVDHAAPDEAERAGRVDRRPRQSH